MNTRITLAVAGRVLTQVRRDHRTLAMLLVVPCVLISLLWWMFEDLPGDLFDRFGPGLLAMFPFIVMFLVTSVTTLRERSSGTLERLLTLPMGKLDFLLGYALAFGLLAAVQSALAVAVSVGLLGLDVNGPVWLLGVVAVVDAVLGTALGLLVSAFATTEFQAVQFMPAFVLPQILLCGLFVPREAMPGVLEAISNVLPLSYAVDAMQELVGAADEGEVWRSVAVVAASPSPRSCWGPRPSGAGRPDRPPRVVRIGGFSAAAGTYLTGHGVGLTPRLRRTRRKSQAARANRAAYMPVSMATSRIEPDARSVATRTMATTPATTVVTAAAARASAMPAGPEPGHERHQQGDGRSREVEGVAVAVADDAQGPDAQQQEEVVASGDTQREAVARGRGRQGRGHASTLDRRPRGWVEDL